MKLSVFIETTIPSMYYETRKPDKLAGWKRTTREFWQRKNRFHFVTSPFVLLELNGSPEPKRRSMLELMSDVEVLEDHPQIRETSMHYVRAKLMPSDALGDAVHLAFSSFHEIEFLATWNCKHLANALKVRPLEHFHRENGLYFPRIVTPLELLEVES